MIKMTIRALFLFGLTVAFTTQAAEHKPAPPGDQPQNLRARYHQEPGGEPRSAADAQPKLKATVQTETVLKPEQRN